MARLNVKDYEKDIEVTNASTTSAKSLANYRGRLNTRVDSTAENKLLLKLSFLEEKGVKSAGAALKHYQQLKWSALGRSREEAVEVEKKVTEPKYFVGGPQDMPEQKQ